MKYEHRSKKDSAIDPATGRSFDDNRRLINTVDRLTDEDQKKIFEDNARKAYPRLGATAAGPAVRMG